MSSRPWICTHEAEYGGLLLSLPSQRMIDVWSDPDYFFAESKPETLLLAEAPAPDGPYGGLGDGDA